METNIADKMLPCTCVSLTCWNAAVGYFFYECTASSKKERGSQGQLTFRLMARSWRAAVLSSDTLTWACIGCTPRLWSSDTLMSPQCQLIDAEYMTPSHPCLLFVGTFSETVKTLLRSCKNWVRAATADGEDADARNGGARCFDIRDTIQSWWLFVGISLHRCAAGRRGGLFTWGDVEIGDEKVT